MSLGDWIQFISWRDFLAVAKRIGSQVEDPHDEGAVPETDRTAAGAGNDTGRLMIRAG